MRIIASIISLSALFLCSPSLIGAQTKQVAVTIDDLPAVLTSNHQDQLKINRKILEALERYHVQATGFVIGNRAPGRTDIFELWLERGHELGNHTYSHMDLDEVDAQIYELDIVKGAFEIEKLLLHHSQSLRYFRFPYLHTGRNTEKGNQVREFLKENCYTIAPVTISPYDWEYNSWYVEAWGSHKLKEEEQIKRMYLDRIETATAEAESLSWLHYGRNIRQILLLHLNRINGEMLDQVLDYYVRSGYTFITLEEVLADSAYSPEGELTKPQVFAWPMTFKLSLPVGR
ncbi:MAG TPA: polysaccharide deacetylase family protein [candidate division Zixibacteria bacterium]